MYFLTQTSWAFLPPNSKENLSSISNQAFYIHVCVPYICNHLRSFHYLVQAFRLVFWDRANQEDKFFRSCCTVACESLGKSRKDQKLQMWNERLPGQAWKVRPSGYASEKWVAQENRGLSQSFLEPNRPGFESSYLNFFVCFLISKWESLYLSQKFCKVK